VLDDLTDVNALISVTVWKHVGSWAGEAVEHRKIAKDAQAGRAESAADRLRSHIEVFQRRVVEALGKP
jgi:DNA-binding GntR family transcriptional regulator